MEIVWVYPGPCGKPFSTLKSFLYWFMIMILYLNQYILVYFLLIWLRLWHWGQGEGRWDGRGEVGEGIHSGIPCNAHVTILAAMADDLTETSWRGRIYLAHGSGSTICHARETWWWEWLPAMEAEMWGSRLCYVDNQQAKSSDKKAKVGSQERAQWVKAYLSSEHLAWLKRWENKRNHMSNRAQHPRLCCLLSFM